MSGWGLLLDFRLSVTSFPEGARKAKYFWSRGFRPAVSRIPERASLRSLVARRHEICKAMPAGLHKPLAPLSIIKGQPRWPLIEDEAEDGPAMLQPCSQGGGPISLSTRAATFRVPAFPVVSHPSGG